MASIGNITAAYSAVSDNAPTVAVPSGAVAGDIFVLVWDIIGTGSVTWPSGFTEVSVYGNEANVHGVTRIAIRTATGSESGSFSGTLSNYTAWEGRCIVVKGVNATPDANTVKNNYAYSTSSSLTGNAITTTGAGRFILWVGAGSSGGKLAATASITPPSGISIDSTVDRGNGEFITIGHGTQASAGTATYSGTASFGAVNDSRGNNTFTLAFVASGGGGTSITSAIGHLTEAGYGPSVSRTANQGISSIVGNVALHGYAAAIGRSYSISGVVGHSLQSGYSPAISQPHAIAAVSGHSTSSGHLPAIDRTAAQLIGGVAGHGSYAGHAATISRTDNQQIFADVGHGHIDGYGPTVSQSSASTIGGVVGHAYFAGYASTVSRTSSHEIGATAGHALFHGYALTVGQAITVAPVAGSAESHGFEPTVSQSNSWVAYPDSGHLLFAGATPALQQPHSISPSTGGLIQSGYVPLVSMGSGDLSADWRIDLAPDSMAFVSSGDSLQFAVGGDNLSYQLGANQ